MADLTSTGYNVEYLNLLFVIVLGVIIGRRIDIFICAIVQSVASVYTRFNNIVNTLENQRSFNIIHLLSLILTSPLTAIVLSFFSPSESTPARQTTPSPTTPKKKVTKKKTVKQDDEVDPCLIQLMTQLINNLNSDDVAQSPPKSTFVPVTSEATQSSHNCQSPVVPNTK